MISESVQLESMTNNPQSGGENLVSYAVWVSPSYFFRYTEKNNHGSYYKFPL